MTDMSYAPLGWSGIQVSKVCLPASMSNEWLEPVDAEAYGKLA